MVDLSIIIVNYNTKELVGQCLSSVRDRVKKLSYEIIVVDNDSSDGSVEFLKKEKIKLITNRKNLGFGRANNQGAKAAEGRYLLFLNSDTELTDDSVEKAVEYLKNNPKTGILGGGLKNKDGSFQQNGGFSPSPFRVFVWMTFLDDIPFLSIKPYHAKPFVSEKAIDWVTGAFMMMKREVFEKVRGFDEDYFMYVEDTDLCLKVKKLGLGIIYAPQFSVLHLGSKSSNTEFSLLGEYKSLKIYYRKHYPKQLWVLRFLLKLGALLRIFTLGFFRKGAFSVYVKAFALA